MIYLSLMFILGAVFINKYYRCKADIQKLDSEIDELRQEIADIEEAIIKIVEI